MTNAFVDTFRRIPPLVAALNGDPNNIRPYIDINPDANSLSDATYQMEPGTLLVVHTETNFVEGEITALQHIVNILIRAPREASNQKLATLLINGVPDPGDGLNWMLCPVMSNLLPTNLVSIGRETDTEGIDYHVVVTATKETGAI